MNCVQYSADKCYDDSFSIFFFLTDIDEMKISYILKKGYNATSDIFYFFIEDKGKVKIFSYTYL